MRPNKRTRMCVTRHGGLICSWGVEGGVRLFNMKTTEKRARKGGFVCLPTCTPDVVALLGKRFIRIFAGQQWLSICRGVVSTIYPCTNLIPPAPSRGGGAGVCGNSQFVHIETCRYHTKHTNT